MALKIVEIASSQGYEVKETYTKSTETVLTNIETGEIISLFDISNAKTNNNPRPINKKISIFSKINKVLFFNEITNFCR